MSFNMYTEVILDLYKNPLNKGKMDDPTIEVNKKNVLCGDDLTIQLKIKDGKIADIKHEGQGCAISQASTSLFTDEVKGKSIDEVKKIKTEEVIGLLGIPISPSREKCALLVYEAVINALKGLGDEKSVRD